ncbi:hypothetical protein [Gemmata sp.]|uniref:hypothetical protein n=1 Tax=Gemmata sp. TaxID=1914242 RepID=UPI003F7084FD
MRAVLLGVAMVACGGAGGQDKTKDYKALDQDATKAFAEGKYDEAAKTWRYIYNDYPRGALGRLPANDPRFIAWQRVFYSAVVREGLSKKHALLASDDAAKRATADKVFDAAVEDARDRMTSTSIPKAEQDKLVKAATQPLLDALKKKDAEKK